MTDNLKIEKMINGVVVLDILCICHWITSLRRRSHLKITYQENKFQQQAITIKK